MHVKGSHAYIQFCRHNYTFSELDIKLKFPSYYCTATEVLSVNFKVVESQKLDVWVTPYISGHNFLPDCSRSPSTDRLQAYLSLINWECLQWHCVKIKLC